MTTKGLLHLIVFLVSTKLVSAAPFYISPEIKALINPCPGLLVKGSIHLAGLDDSEASANVLRERLESEDVRGRFHVPPQHGVGVYIFDSKGRVLLAKRLGSHGSGHWGAPGGKIDGNEGIFEAARREVFEETGLEIDEIRFDGMSFESFSSNGKLFYTYQLTANLKNGQPKVMEPEKVSTEWMWFQPNHLPVPLFAPMAKLAKLGYFSPERRKKLPSR